MSNFYVYVHRRPDGSPFYIGKGKGNRAHQFSRRSLWHKNIVAKYGRDNIRVDITWCESEESAFAIECDWIAKAKIEGHELVNLTDGGEGCSGLVRGPRTEKHRRQLGIAHIGNTYRRGATHTAETRAKMSASHTGKPLPESVRLSKMGNTYRRGKTHTEEAKEKNRQAHLGNKQSAETVEKRAKKLGKPRKSAKGITGVTWHKPNSKLVVKIAPYPGSGAFKHIGYFDNLLDACAARKSAELAIYKSDFS
jgi:hypothetical protein